jgi:hypothetical protein
MTGNDGRSGAPPGPAWSVDLLADLHAGVFDADMAARLRPQVESDPEANAVLAALDATRVDLASMPPLRMPDAVAARLDAALRSEAVDAPSLASRTVPPVVDLAQARRRRNRRLGWGGGVLAVAAAAVGIAIAVVPATMTGGAPQAVPPDRTPSSAAPGPPLALRGEQLGSAAPEVIGQFDYGPLGNASRLDACLRASGVQAGDNPLGVREIQLDGRRGVFIVLRAGRAKFRLVVVGADCGPGKPDKISDTVVG